MPRGQTQHLAVVRETQAGSQLQGSKAPQVPLHFSDRSRVFDGPPNIIAIVLMLFVPVWTGKEKSMIESLFKQASTLARLHSGPLAQQLPFLAEALHKEQYPPETVRRYVRVAEKFGRWLHKNELSINEADEPTLARYRASTGRRQKGQLCAAGRGLAKVLALLRRQH